uniref:Uncharacterized protein n=1 Tax=Romanomermis culicivorax TaxID=13658 RepID=A0A915HN14_ROMCU
MFKGSSFNRSTLICCQTTTFQKNFETEVYINLESHYCSAVRVLQRMFLKQNYLQVADIINV